MATDVIMPQMGESIFEGTITKWLKKPGEKVERDEPLFEISTDKVDAEIPAPAAGVLKEIKVQEGQTVPIQTIVAVIDVDGAGAGPAPPTPAAEPAQKAAPEPKQATVSAAGVAPGLSVPKPAETPARERPTSAEKLRSSPLVRRLAREHNIDLTQLQGTGSRGRISKKDVLGAMEAGAARGEAPSATLRTAGVVGVPVAPPTQGATARVALENAVPRERIYFGRYEARPMSIMRQKIAEHMVISKRVSPHVYSIDEIDMTRIVGIREKAKAEFERRYETKLTFMPFFIRACIEGLRTFPDVNASVDGTSVVYHKEINIGMAVAIESGLIVPVIKNAEEKNFLGLARQINDLADRARNKKLKPEEVQESTFAVTNPGIFGGLMGLPVINQPNVAILGIGAIQKRPVVVNDAIAIRSMVYLALSYDHRVVDGATSHQFIQRVKNMLEGWSEIIM